METIILAQVDYDCDGTITYFQRVDVPDGFRDTDAAVYAMETEQMSSDDPSSWFTLDIEDYKCVPRSSFRFGRRLGEGINPRWASMNGTPW